MHKPNPNFSAQLFNLAIISSINIIHIRHVPRPGVVSQCIPAASATPNTALLLMCSVE